MLLTSHEHQLSTHSVLGMVAGAMGTKMEKQGPSPQKAFHLAHETDTIKVIYQCPRNPFPAYHHSICAVKSCEPGTGLWFPEQLQPPTLPFTDP